MTLADSLRWINRAVLFQRRRNLLTILGFAIGVSAVTLLAAMGDSLKQFVLNEFTQFGSNIIAITPGKSETMGISGILKTNRGISLYDAQALSNLPHVNAVVPIVAGTAVVKHRGLSRSTDILGVGHHAAEAWKMQIAQGRFLPQDNILQPRAFAVLGSKLKDALFGQKSALGQQIRVGSMRFRVIGVFASKGQFLGMDLDEIAYIPAAKALELFNRGSLMEIDLMYQANIDSNTLIEKVKKRLINRHGAEDFTIISQDEMLASLDDILNVVRFAGIAIGSISLLVGTVGIYTILTITLSQRRAEIGLLRALGMQQNLLIKLFLGEAIFIAIFGGLAGLFLLGFIQLMLNLVLPQLPLLFTLTSVSLGLGVSIVVGLVAGALPAYQASRLPPIDALRAE
ncbi:MAG: putative ABC transport system permease protein [Gammaproteobacteria bacterium]|jgi:putative ABC transport system permease protein